VRVETELHGVTLSPPETVYILLGAANRDPRRFEDPDSYDIERDRKDHLSFGAGVHYCGGASLARLMAEIGIEYIFNHFASIRVLEGDEPTLFDGPVYRSPQEVLVELTT
jgi:cytochrome P450